MFSLPNRFILSNENKEEPYNHRVTAAAKARAIIPSVTETSIDQWIDQHSHL